MVALLRRLLAAILSLTVAFSACAIAADPNAVTDAYDFENRLVRKGGVTIVYDGDGNRVSKTAAGSTTQYLVDTLNPTGYAQVVDEIQKGALSRTYSWGLELIDQARPQPSAAPAIVNYYVFEIGRASCRERVCTTVDGGD